MNKTCKECKNIDDLFAKIFEYIPEEVFNEINEVFKFGAKKYTKHGWKEINAEKYRKSLNNHCDDYNRGKFEDDESMLPSLAHIAANAIILLYKELNDRICDHDIVIKFGVAECQTCGDKM